MKYPTLKVDFFKKFFSHDVSKKHDTDKGVFLKGFIPSAKIKSNKIQAF